MFACFDQPDLKASFELTVIAPGPWVVVANTTADIQAAGNAKLHKFTPTARISSYLVALIAGTHARWSDTYSDKAVTSRCASSAAHRCGNPTWIVTPSSCSL